MKCIQVMDSNGEMWMYSFPENMELEEAENLITSTFENIDIDEPDDYLEEQGINRFYCESEVFIP